MKNCGTGTRGEQDALGACDKISGMCRARLGNTLELWPLVSWNFVNGHETSLSTA